MQEGDKSPLTSAGQLSLIAVMDHNALIQAIEAHAAKRNLAPGTITSRAVGNAKLYKRLKDGKSCTVRIAQAVLAYIEAADGGAA